MSAAAALDRAWIEQALALAALGEGTTSPNPRVGCVVVRDGRVVGTGWHRAAGQPHAEALALAEAGAAARGATMYVNLEPCAHAGRTPPCADLLVTSAIARVVASIVDPDPRVQGRGFARLRAAGVAVEVGLAADAARELNAPFFSFHERGRPRVTIKAALSLDGMVSALGGRSRWISGEHARRFAHRLRLRHDAVLVGAGTVRADDPRLDVRLPGVEASRLVAVLAPALDLDPRARLFGRPAGPRPRIYGRATAPTAARARLAAVADVVIVPEQDGRLDLAAVLADLASCGVQSVLVEGGGRTIGAFLAAGLADDAALFVSPALFGAAGGTHLVEQVTVSDPAQGIRLERVRQLTLGGDLLLMGTLTAPRQP